MSGQLTERLAPPRDLRAAEFGIILVGRVIAGHLGATLVDLCVRGLLRIEEIPGDDGAQWLLTDRRGQAPGPGPSPLPFEMALLDGLFGPQAQVRLPGIGNELVPALNRVRTELGRDAIRDRLAKALAPRTAVRSKASSCSGRSRASGQELRARALSGAGVPALLAPYMMIFGLAAERLGGGLVSHDDTATRRLSEIPWARLEAFARPGRTA